MADYPLAVASKTATPAAGPPSAHAKEQSVGLGPVDGLTGLL